MRIDSLRLFQVEGVMEHEGPFWEERLVRPIDIYPEHRYEHRGGLPEVAPGQYRIDSIFVEILTDDGVSGLGGPLSLDQALQIRQLSSVLIGADPIAHERIWDQLYRHAVHGRKGVAMQAISALDCALWDLRGKWLDTPVYRLLGGPVRDSIPAYASALGYSLEPDRVRARARALVEEGYGAMKWFFRWGPPEGRQGMRQNLELVRILRETVGDDVDIMLDCWMSWDLPYAVEMSRQLAEFRPRWLEEPVLPDRVDTCAAIRRAISIPVATGEHEYTRWGIRGLIEVGRRPLRAGQDLRPGLGARSARHSARPLRARQRPPHRRHAGRCVPLAGVPGQVESDPSVLPEGPTRAREWRRVPATGTGPGDGPGRGQDHLTAGSRVAVISRDHLNLTRHIP